jgi:hypothetical protein
MRPGLVGSGLPIRVGVVAVTALMLLGLVATTADGRVLRGTSHRDVLFGTNGSDRINGRAGNDRLYGRGGNDRLIGGAGKDRLVGGRGKDRLVGGPGKDRLICGPGRDTAIADQADLVKSSCEIVRRSSPVGQRGGEPPVAPKPPTPTPPAPPPLAPDYTSILIGSWYQQVPPISANLWFFNNNPTAGYRTGSRSFCPYSNNCGISPYPAAFIWYVKGDLLEIEFYGGITYTEYKIIGYNAATNTLTLTYNGVPTDLVRF